MLTRTAMLLTLGTMLSLCLNASSVPIPDDCREQWFKQRLDHFRWHMGEQSTFPQRLFVCAKHWSMDALGKRGPVFFYAGNEGPVTAYMKSAGLMFENRQAFGAVVVFIEHRYYGKSQPFGVAEAWRLDPSYLTVEQAMADYTTLLHNLTQEWKAVDSPIIAFGGSYGGMLAAWMRRRYPHIIAGAVAASAPVGQFPAVRNFDPSAFWDVVTRDASPAAGAAPDCVTNVRNAFKELFSIGASAQGRAQLQRIFRLCEPLKSDADVKALAYWAQGAFDAYAMGNFPFASDYMTGEGQGELPAWPMRAACACMSRVAASGSTAASASPQLQHDQINTVQQGSKVALWSRAWPSSEGRRQLKGDLQETGLLDQLLSAASILYNASSTASCYNLDLAGPAAGSIGAWDYQVCTQFLGQELPYFPAAASSMFWDQGPFDWDAIVQHCNNTWGVTPAWDWMTVEHGGLDWRGTSNIVFSNGLLDPWHVFGVLRDVSDTVVAVIIPDGAHHLDLMYSRPDDSPGLTAARQTIIQHVARWLRAAGGSQPASRHT